MKQVNVTVNVNVDLMQVFVTIKKGGIIINADVNAKNWFICDKWLISNSSNCECECDKSCDVGEYLDYENCQCRKRLIDKLVEECIEIIDEKNLYSTLNDYEKICSFCTVYIVLFAIFFIIIISISIVFVYFYWYLKSDTNITNINPRTETVIY